MSRIAATCVLVMVLAMGLSAQTPTGSGQESSSRDQPATAPTPPDAPSPDLGQQTSPQAKSKAKKVGEQVRSALHRCDLSRLLVVACGAAGKVLTEEQKKAQQVAEDIEVGYFYMNKNNFIAAESRLREAVELKPDAAAAWVGLGQAQQKLGKNDDARRSYEEYLEAQSR